MGTVDPAGGADPHARARAEMIERQIVARGVHDPRVLAALGRVPRHEFVPPERWAEAYADWPLSIGEEQTISQPYVVAAMTELARLGPGDRVLEIGTGSGYQTAVLAEVAGQVCSIEIVEPLARRARAVLERLGYEVLLRVGDGHAGWPDAAPFDAIVVTAAPLVVPDPLLAQLRLGGRAVVPVGPTGGVQELLVVTRTGPDRFERETIFPVSFVPMTGVAQRRA